jgi:hypothetical protein
MVVDWLRPEEIPRSGRSGCSSAWLERVVWDHEVAGSNPVTPTDAHLVISNQQVADLLNVTRPQPAK